MLSKECYGGSSLHRGKLDIMENILCEASEGAKKTRIMYRCNLNFSQLNSYLDLMVSVGLLKSVPPGIGERIERNTYETSAKGQAFIRAYRDLKEVLDL